MANFMSNTGTANLLLPIVAALGTSGLALESTGGIAGVILGVTLSISLGMSLPISTPPNAMVHGQGGIRFRDLLWPGLAAMLLGSLLLASMVQGVSAPDGSSLTSSDSEDSHASGGRNGAASSEQPGELGGLVLGALPSLDSPLPAVPAQQPALRGVAGPRIWSPPPSL
jgi:Na+/H+ antiporter NhaD/arsenite permease-like protein